jgi:hypothetical protein
MNDSHMFDHHPDPELGAALRAALDPKDDQHAFVARVMARYDETLQRATVRTWEVLASWFRPGVAAAAAALLAGFLVGRSILFPTTATTGASVSMDAAIASAAVNGPGRGVADLVTATSPPDPSIMFASLIEQR